MKFFKRLICFLLSVLFLMNIVAPMRVYAADSKDVNSYISELIAYYRDYQNDAETDIIRTLEEIKKIDETKYESWKQIMDFWNEVNQKNFVNTSVLPDGLPNDDSLCIIVLGFALNSDGTMKQELINRLQVGLDSAKKYPNSYIAVTGGGTAANNPNVTEGGLMGQWLLDHGLDEKRLIVENKAPDTVGNAKNTYKILNTNYPQVKSLAMVTSDYHVPRGSVIFFTQCLLSAYEAGNKPLQMISNAGCITGSSGYESISLQASGVSSVAGVSAAGKLELSKLNGLIISQESPYVANKDLKLKVEAQYNSRFSRDVSHLIKVTHFDPTKGPEQIITLSYKENGIEIVTDFQLSEISKEVCDNTYLKDYVTEIEKMELGIYTKESVNALINAIQKSKEILNSGNSASKEEIDLAYQQLNKAVNELVELVNIAYKMNVDANCNQKNAYKINDGVKNTSNYWASENNGNVASKDAEFIIDLDGVYNLEHIVVYPYWGGQRIYQYELYGSDDKISWVKIGENISENYATQNGFNHEINTDKSFSYIKLKGIKTMVVGRPDINNIHIVELEVFGQEKNNLAYLKPVTSSSTDNSASSSSNSKNIQVVDGNRQTYWDAGVYSKNPWIIVDLQDVYLLDKLNVITYWARNDRYYYYDIYTSIDGEDYKPLYSKTEGTEKSTIFGENIDISHQETYARYVKLIGKYDSANASFHLNKLRVYGKEVIKEADYTMVDEVIAKANQLNREQYTQTSLSKLDQAIDEVVRNKKIYEQEVVDGYVVLIEKALNELQYKSADYSQVEMAIKKANDINRNLYTKDSLKILDQAINAVEKNLNITKQEEVNIMANTIEKALNELQYKSADYSQVETAIKKANDINRNLYTEDSLKILDQAINAVEKDLNITKQKEVDAMADAIEKAIATLTKKEIPDINVNPVVPINPDVSNNNVETNDNTTIAFYIGTIIITVLATGVVLVKKREEY